MLSSSNSWGRHQPSTGRGHRGIWDARSECNSDVPTAHLRGWALFLTNGLTSRKHACQG